MTHGTKYGLIETYFYDMWMNVIVLVTVSKQTPRMHRSGQEDIHCGNTEIFCPKLRPNIKISPFSSQISSGS